MLLFRAAAMACALLWPVADAAAQCRLANPSFELPGTGGASFGGWSEMGAVAAASGGAPHGAVAARLSGPGGPGVSSVWQELDAAPGQVWSGGACVWHEGTSPLTGSSEAHLILEWRNAGGGVIDAERHVLADAGTPPDRIRAFSMTGAPAPAGTASLRFELGVLQGASVVPEVRFDLVTLEHAGPPDPEERPWNDFPGGRTLDFAGRSWRVKGPGHYGPGPSVFRDDGAAVWVDAEGRLHLTIADAGGTWASTEVALESALGYGDHVFTTRGRLDDWDPHVVLGMFLWDYGPCDDPAAGWWNPNNEIDVEFSRWGIPGSDVGQFVAQPYDHPGNLVSFGATFSEEELTSHAFLWLPDRVDFRSWRGGPADETPASRIHAWAYTGPHVPRPERARVHINLWQFQGVSPSTPHEVVCEDFTFTPAFPGGHDSGTSAPLIARDPSPLSDPRPSPFRDATLVRLVLPAGTTAQVAVLDVRGRRVRSLWQGTSRGAAREILWDGRTDRRLRAPAGIYWIRLRTDRGAFSRRAVLVR